MNATVYILFSKQLNKYYIGATQNHLHDRILKHNDHSYGKHRFTARADDWELYLSIIANDFAHAIRIERKIKSMKSRVFIENLKRYPEMIDRIKQQTNT